MGALLRKTMLVASREARSRARTTVRHHGAVPRGRTSCLARTIVPAILRRHQGRDAARHLGRVLGNGGFGRHALPPLPHVRLATHSAHTPPNAQPPPTRPKPHAP